MAKHYSPLPTLRLYHESPAQIRCIVGPVGCYSGDTEFLSPDGWRRFDSYSGGEVAQWDSANGYMSFCKPKSVIKAPCGEMILFRNKHSLSMAVSPEHRMPLYNYRGQFGVHIAMDVEANPSRYTVPINFTPTAPDYTITDENLRVQVMFCADGSVQKAGFKHRVVVRKERKKQRIKELLESAGIEYTEHPAKNRPTEIGFAFIPPIATKRYSPWAWYLSQRQLKIVVDEIQYWDGLYEGPDSRFSTTSKEDADFIQYAVHATGGRATISSDYCDNNPNWAAQYVVHIASQGSPKATVMLRCDTTRICRIIPDDGVKYCFEVDTGFLVVRHNGRVFISGNSGKTTAAAWENVRFIPKFMADTYGVTKTRGVIVRNTYDELIDTTQKTVFDWFPPGEAGEYQSQRKTFDVRFDDGIECEILFRSCDRKEDVKKFKSLELTWYWIDESIEVKDEIKRMLKNRIGRYPAQDDYKKLRPGQETPRFGTETTNPPDVTHPTYTDFKWHRTPPGPVPEGQPLKGHAGFWQPPRENEIHLPANYYAHLRNDYANNPGWIDMYIDGKPGVIAKGKLVYHNFKRDAHQAKSDLIWSGFPLYRGWDDSGNVPACVVVGMPSPRRLHVLREFHSDRMNIVDFARHVVSVCAEEYPNANWFDWDDPAGWNEYSTKEGGFTSNAKLIRDATGIDLQPSEQNLTARINAVDQQLATIDGLLIDPRCVRLLNGFLGGYCYPEVGNTGVYRDKPDKNRFSHVHDALQYVIIRLTKNVASNHNPYVPPRAQRSRR